MKRKTTFWLLFALAALIITGCTTENNNSGDSQPEALKPPQVRVVALPSATATLALPEEALAPTVSPTATAAVTYYIQPTPDEDAIVSQIDAMMDEIDQKLNSQDLNLKP